jgi:hypothetical protein
MGCLARLNTRVDMWFRQMFLADWEDYDLLT